MIKRQPRFYRRINGLKMKNELIIALDQGSSSSRALAVTAQGVIAAKAAVPLLPKHEENICEYNGEELLKSQFDALNTVISALPAGQTPSQIAVACQRSTIVLWDKITGKTLCPVLSWIDGRAAAIIAQNTLSQEEVHFKTGLYKTPYFSAPKLQWCLQNYPAVQEALKENRLLAAPVATFIIWHLTGGKVFAADPTTAQRTLLFNIKTMAWDADILKSFNIPPSILPQIRPSAADYGDYKGIPITVCVGDQQAAAAAAGLLGKGDNALNYGTGAFLLADVGTKPVDLQGILTSLSWNSAQKNADYLLEGPLNTAGALLTWLGQTGFNFDIKDLDALCAQSRQPVWFLPALGGLGAPYWDFSLTPVIKGFTPKTTKADIVCGAVRGLCFLMVDIAFYMQRGGVQIKELRASGGLSSNKTLLQFQSDILQVNITKTPEAETTALGAAFIAAQNSGLDALNWPVFKAEAVFTPSISAQAAKEEYLKWRQFFDWATKQPK